MSQVDLFASDEDIVAETPEKITKKKRKITKVVKVTHSIIRRSSEISANNSYDNIKLNYCKKPYIFYEIKEILNFTMSAAPLNNNLKTVGRFFEHDSKTYLVEHTESSSVPSGLNIAAGSATSYSKPEDVLKLRLDLEVVSKIPKPNELIEVFGHLDFSEDSKSLKTSDSVPLIVVKFFIETTGEVGNYIQVLKRVRKLAPKIALQIVDKNVSANDWSCNVTNDECDIFFDDGAESFLNKHADVAEVICSGSRGLLVRSDDSS